MYAGFRRLHPLRRLGLTLQLSFFLSFAHVIRSSIRALADERPAVTPIRVIRPVSTAVSGMYIFSHSPPSLPPSLSFCSTHPHAPIYSGAPINARRAQLDDQLDAQPDAEHHPTPRRGTVLPCRAPSSPVLCKPSFCSCSVRRVGERRSTWRVLSWCVCVCCNVA